MKSTSAQKISYDFYYYLDWLTSRLYTLYRDHSEVINHKNFLIAFLLLNSFLRYIRFYFPSLLTPIITSPISNTVFILVLLFDVINNIYKSSAVIEEQKYFDACKTVIPSFIQIIGIYYVFLNFLLNGAYFNHFDIYLSIASILYVAFNAVKLIKTEPKFNTRFFLKTIPILIMILALVCYFNPFEMMTSVYYFHEIQVYSNFAFVMLAGMYDYKDNKILSGTLDVSKWQKYVLGFAIKMCLIFLAFDYDVVLVANLIPFWSYVSYVLLLVPLVFNQTLAEEYIFRSFVYKTKDSFDPYKIIFSLLCLVAVCSFVLGHVYQFQNTSAPILFTFAVHFLNALSWMIMAVVSGGVEYSSGYHFGNNLMISLLLPFLSLASSHSITLNISVLAYRTIVSSVVSFMIFIPVVLLERNFSLKSELKIDPKKSTELKNAPVQKDSDNKCLIDDKKENYELATVGVTNEK